ncbi:hypothetical protein RclHR1_17190005 [Rhizophagus clarus]|nr:hypothetical protein RclHR1_17190005 [Rhizophagus clarus]
MDIEISPLEMNQSTLNTMLITNNTDNDDTSLQPVVSKSQKKKQRKKAKAEREATKATKSSHSSLDPLAKKFTPPTRLEQTGDETLILPPEKKARPQGKLNIRKVVENEASTVITGYQPAHNSQAFIRDIIVYDILAKWDNYTTINALSAWRKVISITVKRQKKYKILRVKLEISQFFKNYEKHWMAPLMSFPVRWFPASWSLQERKERERYQAAVLNPPESMTSATLVHKDNEEYLISHNINMFKEVKLPDRKRKIIGYLSNWDDLYRLINTPNVWNGKTVDWTRYTSPSHNPRKSTKSPKNKSREMAKSTNASSPNYSSAKTRSNKKVATGANNIPVRHKIGNASQQQYSSSTKHGKDSLKTEYNDKKHKSKSKRSSTLKKMIMAEITRMNKVLENLLKRTTI